MHLSKEGNCISEPSLLILLVEGVTHIVVSYYGEN